MLLHAAKLEIKIHLLKKLALMVFFLYLFVFQSSGYLIPGLIGDAGPKAEPCTPSSQQKMYSFLKYEANLLKLQIVAYGYIISQTEIKKIDTNRGVGEEEQLRG